MCFILYALSGLWIISIIISNVNVNYVFGRKQNYQLDLENNISKHVFELRKKGSNILFTKYI